MTLEIQGLCVHYKHNQILDHVNLKVDEGNFFTILGKSGSGKSTILKAIAGLLDHHEGQIFLEGVDITQDAAEQRPIGFVFQKPLLFPHLTIYDNVAFGPEIHGWPKDKIDRRVRELMALVQIEGLENRMPEQVSGGQQQRAAIARALALNHRLLLLDEPFSSLDPYLRDEMGQLVKQIQQELNLTVIFVTHDVSEAMRLSHQIGFLNKDHLEQIGTPRELYNHPANAHIAEFMGDVNWIEGTVENGLFMTPIGHFPASEQPDGPGTLLLRPHDLVVDPDGKDFEVTQCNRFGKETVTDVKKGDLTLRIVSLEDRCYKDKDTLGVLVKNEYWHYI